MRTALGVALAAIASLLFNSAIILQTHESRTVAFHHGLRASLLGTLIQRPRWLVGGGLQVAGFGLQTGALLLAPVTAVQPADAVGLVLLVVLAWRWLDEHVGRAEIIAVCLIIAGVAGLTAVAPKRKVADLDAASVWIAISALGLISLAPYAVRRWLGAGSRLTVVGAGLSFALTAFCTKLIADALVRHDWGAAVLFAAVAALGAAIGMLSEQSSLQQRQATQVAPLIFIFELLVPILLAVTVVGESWQRSPVAITVCLTVVTAGTLILGRAPTIAQLAAGREED